VRQLLLVVVTPGGNAVGDAAMTAGGCYRKRCCWSCSNGCCWLLPVEMLFVIQQLLLLATPGGHAVGVAATVAVGYSWRRCCW